MIVAEQNQSRNEVIRAFVVREGINAKFSVTSLTANALQNHAVLDCLDTYYVGMNIHKPNGRHDKHSAPWLEASYHIKRYVRMNSVRWEAAKNQGSEGKL